MDFLLHRVFQFFDILAVFPLENSKFFQAFWYCIYEESLTEVLHIHQESDRSLGGRLYHTYGKRNFLKQILVWFDKFYRKRFWLNREYNPWRQFLLERDSLRILSHNLNRLKKKLVKNPVVKGRNCRPRSKLRPKVENEVKVRNCGQILKFRSKFVIVVKGRNCRESRNLGQRPKLRSKFEIVVKGRNCGQRSKLRSKDESKVKVRNCGQRFFF